MIRKVISGGQTGIDQVGLKVASLMNIRTGGIAPKGYRTERGYEIEKLIKFNLIESSKIAYSDRTIKNITASDGTVLFGNMGSPGSFFTLNICKMKGKAHIVNPTSEELSSWIKQNEIEILNVAGNRGSKLTREYMLSVAKILKTAFENNLERPVQTVVN